MTTPTRRRDHLRRPTPRRTLLTAALAITLAAPAALASTTAAAAPTGDPDRAAAGYLADQLDADQPSATQLADAILAFAATGSAGTAAAEAFDGLGSVDQAQLDRPGTAAKALLAASALGEDPSVLGDPDVETVLRDAIEDDGQVGASTQLFTQSLAVLALSTTDGGVPEPAVDFLVAGACDDGGYVFGGRDGCQDPGGDNDPDTTAVAAQARLAAGVDASDQIDWLLAAQDDATGGFASEGLRNSNSSALAAQALRAAGEDAAADAAAGHVATLFEGCDAPVDVRGSYRFTTDQPGDRRLASSQAVFATAPSLDQLDGTRLAAEVERLNCADTFCPPATGVSVTVDFTTLDPDAGVDVRCATDLPDDPSGLDVLRAAGFEVQTQEFDFGVALCAIDGLPQVDEDDCFGGGGFYNYLNAPQGGDWTTYGVGAGDSAPQVGTLEGFAWTEADGAPPRVSTTPAGFDRDALPFDRGLATICPGRYDDPFTDVDADSVHALAIACLASTPIIEGTGDGTTFAPARNVTRDQIASLLVRAVERATGEELPTGGDGFDDTVGNVHETAIDKLATAEVVRGTGDGSTFEPREPLSRDQMATVLDRTLDLLDGSVDGSLPASAPVTGVFSDVSVDNVHGDAIDRLAGVGVVAGRADGAFQPGVDVRRDQIVSFLARALDHGATDGLTEPIAGN